MKFLSIFILLISLNAFAISAVRGFDESYEAAASRNMSKPSLTKTSDETQRAKKSVYKLRKKYGDLNFAKLPEVESLEKLQEYFEYLRNLQFLKDKERETLRRSSWFYADDGCWIRAELMKVNLAKFTKIKPMKVFIFGKLRVETKFNPRGYVSWWYHVAPIVRVGNEAYVFDPSIIRTKPVTLEQWALTQVSDLDDAKYSICKPNSYGPKSSCKRPYRVKESSAKKSQGYYLKSEAQRLSELGYDLDTYLGENPPWNE